MNPNEWAYCSRLLAWPGAGSPGTSRTTIYLVGLLSFVGVAFTFPRVVRGAEFEAPYRAYDTGPNCVEVALGDLNEDGYADMVTANSGSSSLTTYFGLGDGSFGPRADLSISSGINNSVVLADLNGDGHLDIVTAKPDLNPGVTYRLGFGDGTFGSTTRLIDSLKPSKVRVVDLDGDGHPDLVGLDRYATIVVWLGVAGGSFGNPTYFPAENTLADYQQTIAVGDVDGDGAPDLVVTGYPFMVTLLGRGDGTFNAPFSSGGPSVSLYQHSAALAEVTGDGVLDLIAPASPSPGMSVYRSVGDGTFAFLATSAASASSAAIAAEDLNGDGKIDVLSGVDCLLGNGDGTFQGFRLLNGAQASSVAIGLLNADNRADVVLTNGTRTAYVLLGHGDGTFDNWRHVTTAGTPTDSALSDLNGDGHADLATTIDLGSVEGEVEVRLGQGDGTLGPPMSFLTGLGPAALVVADFNEDQIPDIVTANPRDPFGYSRFSLLPGQGDGTFGPHSDFVDYSGAEADLAAADLDGDGHQDLIVSPLSSDQAHISYFYRGVGDGHFVTPGQAFPGGGHPVGVGDVNGDGRPDVITMNSSSNLLYYNRNLGDGTFAPAVPIAAVGAPSGARLGDFNEDGRMDLAVLNGSTPATGIPYATSIHIGYGDGTFEMIGLMQTGGEPRDLVVSDLDGDGHLDLTSAGFTSRSMSVLYGDGTGTFPTRTDFGTGGRTVALTAGDLDGDGRPDFAAVDALPAGVTLLLQPPSISAAPERPALGLALLPAYPNPMTSITTIAFTLAQAGAVRVQIFDVRGRLVARLSDRHFEAGAHAVAWNGVTEGGAQAPSGIYFYALEFGGQRVARTLTLVR